ncbi:hypothetical protein BDV11DRAFT_199665 [Aspergillus similis]
MPFFPRMYSLRSLAAVRLTVGVQSVICTVGLRANKGTIKCSCRHRSISASSSQIKPAPSASVGSAPDPIAPKQNTGAVVWSDSGEEAGHRNAK